MSLALYLPRVRSSEVLGRMEYLSIKVHYHMPLTASTALEHHFIRLVSRYVLSGLSAMCPPAEWIECGEANRAPKHCAVGFIRELHALGVLVFKVSVKE